MFTLLSYHLLCSDGSDYCAIDSPHGDDRKQFINAESTTAQLSVSWKTVQVFDSVECSFVSILPIWCSLTQTFLRI